MELSTNVLIISTILVVLLAFGAVYYFGYFATEPDTPLEPEAQEIVTRETLEVNDFQTLVFTEEKINSLLSRATTLVAENNSATKLYYAQARLVEDKMLLSITAEALGIRFDAEDTEIRFQGTEMTVSGTAKIGKLSVNFSGSANISLSSGNLTIDIKEMKLPRTVSLFMPQLREENLIQYLNQKLAENPFSLPIQELEEITIKDGELIIKGR